MINIDAKTCHVESTIHRFWITAFKWYNAGSMIVHVFKLYMCVCVCLRTNMHIYIKCFNDLHHIQLKGIVFISFR